ncbi:MAG TPA: hypothetical protein VEM96_09540 [Pyrinomonadaceae bacterium]|nr:hypothetical protein [Pyrinomonadaceae bacterium]
MQESLDQASGPPSSTRQLALRLFVLEYSLTEGPLIRTLEKVLQDNINNVRKRQRKDYLPVGVFESYEEASRLREQINRLLSEEDSAQFSWQRIADVLQNLLEQIVSDPDFKSPRK